MAELNARPAELQIKSGVDPAQAPILALSGELDSSNASSLDGAIAPIIARHPERVIFDLANLRFMDSAGIAVLVATAAHTTVELINPSPIIRRVIAATGLSGVLQIRS